MDILAIDNGVTSGALCYMSELGPIISMVPMFHQKTRKGNEVDVRAVLCWVRNLNITPKDAVVVIEEPGGSKSYTAAVSMNGCFQALRALFELADYRVVRLTPNDWQKPFLRAGKGDTKKVAKQMARSLWPEESFLATPKCKTMHEGMVDAACIAEHARRNKL